MPPVVRKSDHADQMGSSGVRPVDESKPRPHPESTEDWGVSLDDVAERVWSGRMEPLKNFWFLTR